MATTIEYNVQINDSNTLNSLGAMEAKLEQLNQELRQVDVNSDAFKRLSAEIQGVTREVNRTNAAVEGLTIDKKIEAADGAIKGFAGSISAATGALGLLGVESETFGEFEKKAASAIALSMGLKDIAEGFKQIRQSGIAATAAAKLFGTTTRAAIAASGIGLLVIALGTVVAYWDDITQAIGGVSSEQKKLNAQTQDNVDLQQQKLDKINGQDETLKLQGKSEKQILDLKIKQTQEVIEATKKQIEQSVITNKAQIATAQRNKDILKGIMEFINTPLRTILTVVDTVGKAMGKNFGLAEGFNSILDGASSMIFDPEGTKKEGDAALAELQKSLDTLTNTKAGYQNKVVDINKKAAADAKTARDKNAADALVKAQETSDAEMEIIQRKIAKENLSYEQQRQLISSNTKLTQDAKVKAIQEIGDAEAAQYQSQKEKLKQIELKTAQDIEDILDVTNLQKIERQKQRDLAELDALKLAEEEKALARIEIVNKYKLLEEEAKKADDIKAEEEKVAKLELSKEFEDLTFERKREEIAAKEEILKNDLIISEENRNALIKQYSDARKQIDQEEGDYKEQQYRTIYDQLQNILSAGGKKMQKVAEALAIADVIRTSAKAVSQTVSSTAAANAAAVAASPLTGGMPFVGFNTAKAALSIGSTIASAAKAIQGIKNSGSGGGAPSAGGMPSAGGGGAPGAAPTNSSNTIPTGTAPQSIPQPTIQTYVLSGNVSSALEADRRL